MRNPSVPVVGVRLWNYARASTTPVLAPLVLSAAGILAGSLMLVSLGERPLWFDETVSVEAAKLPPESLVHYVTSTESNMGAYHVLLHMWLWLGSGDGFARLLSVVFGLLTLPVLFALARRLFDTRTAVIAVALLAANVNFVGHAREARGYSLAVLLVATSSLLLVLGVQDRRRRYWILYAVTSALAVYTHVLALLAILAQAGSVFVVRKRVPVRAFAAASAVIALLLVPLATTLLVHRQQGQIEWITSPRLRQLPGLFVWFVGSWPLAALFAAAGLVGLASAVGDWRRERSPLRLWRYVLLLGWLAFPPLAAFAISFAQPVYLYRYFLISLPALVIVVAVGLARIRRLWLLVPAVAAAVAVSTYETAACTPGCVIGEDDWRSAAAHIEAHARPGDGIIFSPRELRTPFVHYLHPSQRPQLVYPARWLLEGGPAEGAPTLARAIAEARSHPRIWLVSWWLPAGDAPTELARGRGSPTVVDFAGNVRLLLYGPARR